jgi:hypothetical protein
VTAPDVDPFQLPAIFARTTPDALTSWAAKPY